MPGVRPPPEHCLREARVLLSTRFCLGEACFCSPQWAHLCCLLAVVTQMGRVISWERLMSYGSSFLFCTSGLLPIGPIVFAMCPGGLPSFRKIEEKEGTLLEWLPFPDVCLHGRHSFTMCLVPSSRKRPSFCRSIRLARWLQRIRRIGSYQKTPHREIKK